MIDFQPMSDTKNSAAAAVTGAAAAAAAAVALVDSGVFNANAKQEVAARERVRLAAVEKEGGTTGTGAQDTQGARPRGCSTGEA